MTKTITLTWGETVLANPKADSGVKMQKVFMGSASEMSDGSMRIDTIGPTALTKQVITLAWPLLTETEFSTLVTAFNAYAYQSTVLKLEETETTEGSFVTTELWSYNVFAVHNNLDESQWWDWEANPYRNVTLRFDEA